MHALFEEEAARFHDLSLSILYMTQERPRGRRFKQPNHLISLWQHYGDLADEASASDLARDIATSDFVRGIRGAAFSCFALVEGQMTEHFVRMATRAGALFTETEAADIHTRATADFLTNAKAVKPIAVRNSNRCAVWLNYALHVLGKTHPAYLSLVRIELDPFAASLAALDQLGAASQVSRSVPSPWPSSQRFKVALSFPGDRRAFVQNVASELRCSLGEGAVFYDQDYQADLARPNLDLLLQDVYRNRSDLVAVFLSQSYVDKNWCGLEWRVVREMILQKDDDRIMLFRFDDAPIPGLLNIDGYMDLRPLSSADVAKAIVARVRDS